jgi:hypothetical protein
MCGGILFSFTKQPKRVTSTEVTLLDLAYSLQKSGGFSLDA